MRTMKSFIFALLCGLAPLGAGTAHAQAFPTRPVTIIVPYPPGGLIDLVARQIQARFQTELGQSVIIENRSGAGGNVGAEAVARATPDGHTLLLANPSLAISPLIYPKLNYKPIEDFAYVGQYGTVPNVLVVHPSIPANTVQEFIAYVKKNPGKLNYGSPGYGTSPQMSSELFKAMTNTFIVHIPFRGSGPAQTAMLSGEIQMMFDNLPPQLPHIRSGRVRALAVTSLKRSAVLPDLPTLDEQGYRDVYADNWYALYAPAKTPAAVIAKLNSAFTAALKDPEVGKKLLAAGAVPAPTTPEELGEILKSDLARWGTIIKGRGIKID